MSFLGTHCGSRTSYSSSNYMVNDIPSEPGSDPKPELDSDGMPKPPEFPDFNDETLPETVEEAYEKFQNAPTDPAPPPDEDDRVTILEFPPDIRLQPKPLPGMHLPSYPGKASKTP